MMPFVPVSRDRIRLNIGLMETLYEDAALIAVLKPAGITVIPARNEPPEVCLTKQLEATRRERLWVVHRIDRDTSGVVLFARTAVAHRRLSMAFEGRDVEKRYLAFTHGVPMPEEGTIDLPLHAARKGRMRPALPGEPESLPSSSDYRVLKQRETLLGPVALVEVRPRSGRQHQIRVHLRSKEAPLLVDPLYGKCEQIAADALGTGSPAVPRLTLHAQRITFRHPTDGEERTIDAPLPSDLAALDAWL